jgi:hypothetical protein
MPSRDTCNGLVVCLLRWNGSGGASVKLPRRKFLHLAAGAAALPALTRAAGAQAYPSRPVRIIVGFQAGGQIDIIARLMGQWLTDRLSLHAR